MSNRILFKEKQKFSQWWLWLIFIGWDSYVFFTMVIQTKDSRFRYQIKDLVYHYNVESPDNPKIQYNLSHGEQKRLTKRRWDIIMYQSEQQV